MLWNCTKNPIFISKSSLNAMLCFVFCVSHAGNFQRLKSYAQFQFKPSINNYSLNSSRALLAELRLTWDLIPGHGTYDAFFHFRPARTGDDLQ